MTTHHYFATCPAGVASLLASELKPLGATRLRTRPAGVGFTGDLAVGYRACLWLRTANRVLLRLVRAPIGDRDSLYAVVRTIDWRDHLHATGTLAVDFSGAVAGVTHPHFGAQVVKDAIVDQFRERTGERPSVDASAPDLRINARVDDGMLDVYIDLSGDSLHRRGYRLDAGPAPLKENLAAALLLLAGWPEEARSGAPLLDPMCGAGTLPIEAALIALDIAPGLLRERFGFSRWLGHRADTFADTHDEAIARRRDVVVDTQVAAIDHQGDAPARDASAEDAIAEDAIADTHGPASPHRGPATRIEDTHTRVADTHDSAIAHRRAATSAPATPTSVADAGASDSAPVPDTHREAIARRSANPPLPPIYGFDADPRAIAAAVANARRAGVARWIRFERRAIADCREAVPYGAGAGLIATNPPYGERLSTKTDAARLYAELGGVLARDFAQWRAAVLLPAGAADDALGVAAPRHHRLRNGPLDCRVDLLTVRPAASAVTPPAEDASAFRNRLAKNAAQLRKWARREGIDCYRVYDRDVPEFAFAIDLYDGPDGRHAHVQEYAPPASVDASRSAARAAAVLAAVPDVLDLPGERVHGRVRERMREQQQYRKLGESGQLHEVAEHGRRLLVNFDDYLDTGVFLDHRPIRQMIAARVRDRDFLNLFCYAGAATVAAARGGARSTTSVDISPTYLAWAERNLGLNGFGGDAHRLVRADCTTWLPSAAKHERQYGLILLDPPTFSHGKRMRDYLEVQRDHPALIAAAARLLTDDGVLLFSTNYRRFRLDADAIDGTDIIDISASTIARDFARNPRIHRCFEIRRAAARSAT